MIFGKVYFQQGVWEFRKGGSYDLGLKHFGESVDYFYKFWPKSRYLTLKVQTISQHIKIAGFTIDMATKKLNNMEAQYSIDLSKLTTFLTEV